MRRPLVVLVVAAVAPAWADKAKPLSAAEEKTYDDGVHKGRALQGKKDWAGAIAAFQSALAVSPDDPVALGELGWTQYLAKDLANAEASTRKALAGDAQPWTRGASFYNLGLIEEAKHDTAAAIAAYKSSLQTRPNGVVRRTLAKLDATAAAAFDPFKPTKLAGPFPSADGLCQTLPKTAFDEYEQCACKVEDTRKATRALAAPFTQVEQVDYLCTVQSTEAGDHDYGIAVRTASGWYGAMVASVPQNRHCNDAMTLTEASATPIVASGGVALAIHWAITGDCEGNHGGSTWSQTGLQVIGGTAPSATPVVSIQRQDRITADPYSGDPGKLTTDIALSVAWTKTGATITGKTTGMDKDEASNLLGQHPISFP